MFVKITLTDIDIDWADQRQHIKRDPVLSTALRCGYYTHIF